MNLDHSPRLYTDLAPWFHLLTQPADYAEEAAFFQKIFESSGVSPMETLLELGSGGGNNASHLKRRFRLTLADLSPDMLALSRTINPECEHIQGDMRSVRLGREFDAVFIHDAICYMTSEDDLLRALQTAFVHCRPGGIALFVPDETCESFQPSTDSGGHDGADRSLRYLEWDWDPDPSDSTYITDFAYLLREPNRSVRCLYDRHILGLFPTQTWLDLISAAGFQPAALPFEHSEVEPGTLLFTGRK
jgi:SAM-dependent methyltransferase